MNPKEVIKVFAEKISLVQKSSRTWDTEHFSFSCFLDLSKFYVIESVFSYIYFSLVC